MYIFTDNTDCSHGVRMTKAELLRQFRKMGPPRSWGNAYWYSVSDDQGHQYRVERGPRGGVVDIVHDEQCQKC